MFRCFQQPFLVQTVAEKKAWEMSKQHDFELATIMPSLVLGPIIGTRSDGTSINAMKVRFANSIQGLYLLHTCRIVQQASVSCSCC